MINVTHVAFDNLIAVGARTQLLLWVLLIALILFLNNPFTFLASTFTGEYALFLEDCKLTFNSLL